MTAADGDGHTRRRLNAAASTLLPGNADWPDGGTLGLADRMIARAAGTPRFRAALDEFLRQPDEGLSPEAGSAARDEAMAALQARDPGVFGLLLMVVYDAYYTHPDVLALISARTSTRPGPPQPEGHRLPLLAPRDLTRVQQSGVRWRDDGEPAARAVRDAQVADPDRVWSEEEIASWSE